MAMLAGASIFISFLGFAAFGIVLYYLALAFLKMQSVGALRDPYCMPIGAFIGTISTAWALSLGFVAADVWGVNARADSAASKERSAIHRLLGTAHTQVLNDAILRQAVENYRTLVIDGEWGKGNNITPTPDVENAILAIRIAMQSIAMSDVPNPIVSQLVNDFDELQDARNDRLAVANTSIDQYKWYLVLMLTLLSAATIAVTHADRPRAGKKALILFSLAASTSLWILAIHSNPYDGVGEIQPALLLSSQKH